MNFVNRTTKYGLLTISLHWLIFLLMAATYFTMEIRGIIPKEEPVRDILKLLHYLLGLSILALFVPRLINFLKSITPAIEPPHSHKQTVSASFVKFALYVMMIGMPLSGWLMLSAKAKTVSFSGIDLPMIIGENKRLAWVFQELHEIGGTVGYFLIGLHVLAALYCHYFIKDNTLKRMLPWKTN
jgi:cytochrome b561